MNRRRALLDLLLRGPAGAALCAGAGAALVRDAAAADAEARRADEPAVVARLRGGRCAVLLRHAATDPGVGDPPGFRADACATQRNLNAEGREQARRIGAWFAVHGLVPAAVRSSAWCRCLDTATLAFGRVDRWPALDSTFAARSRAGDAGAREIAARLGTVPAGRFEVWVTHQVNITALTGEFVAMGAAWVVTADAADAAALRTVGRLEPG